MRLFLGSVLGSFAMSLQVYAAEGSPSVRATETSIAAHAHGSMGYYRLITAAASVDGIEFDAGVRIDSSPSFSYGMKIRQAFSRADGLTTLFTGLDVDFAYAPFASESATAGTTSYDLDQWRVVKIEQHRAGGFRLLGSINQLSVNTSKAAVPFSGVGLGAEYEVSGYGSFSWKAGMTADRLTNGKVMLVPIQVYLGLNSTL